ncbi:SDR family NAD(P)-dependent oxidoreductase [uncultured Tateyamaria sp.]|uniref:SDR family NAD(P)-dependent oxidoreductase n=1 Tax=uncultured Tateyamaria sp. TaxID=455651 RepID=UPI0026267079|nr:SDR family oxidoreductase [uncultured Tateyamaria sp.]
MSQQNSAMTSPAMPPEALPAPEVAVVTGAGRGLGRHLALELAAQGLSVAALGRKMVDLETLATETASNGGTVLPVLADVSDMAALRAAFDRIDAELGPVDILFNNAAVYPHRDFLDETPESFQHVMDINLGGTLTCAMLALERMVPRGRGRIINVATFAGNDPTYLASAYSVSKGACRILTKSMVRDLGDRFHDILINDWVPGALQTEMGLPDGTDPAVAAKWGVALALWHDQDLNGVTFDRDCEQLPVLSLKRRLFNKLTGRTKAPRRIPSL